MTAFGAKDYRPDIDGLRAVAVMAVILFHYGFSFLPGGFVGVDIFFVISGYLITSIIINDVNAGNFTFRNFYLRRARRILPALYTVLVCCIPLSFLLFLPADLINFGKSLISTILFGSNIFFMQETGYFSAPALTKPLLHTWSLSVEEQFYFVFPAIILLLKKYTPKYFYAALLVLFAGNLVLSEVARDMSQTKAFFLSPTRGWEFLLGSLLTYPAISQWKSKVAEQVAALCGVAMIAYSAAVYTEFTDFPGLGAVLPCLGAGLLVFAGTGHCGSIVSRILASKPFVYVGLRSYSLYLWHWPVLVFAAYAKPEPLAWYELCGLAAVAFGLCVVSYRWIEVPCRKKEILSDNRRFVKVLLGVSACLLLLAAVPLFYKGLPQRFPGIDGLAAQKESVEARCVDIKAETFDKDKCRFGKTAQKEDGFIVWGDSHAYAMTPAIDDAAKKHGKAGYLSSNSGCPPLSGPADTSDCGAINALVFKDIHSGMTVFLVARWNYYVHKSAINHEGSPYFGKTEEESLDVLAQRLEATVKAIKDKGAKPVIVLPGVEFFKDVPETVFITGRDVNVSQALVEENNRVVTRRLMALAKQENVSSVSSMEIMCDGQLCRGSEGMEPYYLDNDHLNKKGALRLGPLFERAFER